MEIVGCLRKKEWMSKLRFFQTSTWTAWTQRRTSSRHAIRSGYLFFRKSEVGLVLLNLRYSTAGSTIDVAMSGLNVQVILKHIPWNHLKAWMAKIDWMSFSWNQVRIFKRQSKEVNNVFAKQYQETIFKQNEKPNLQWPHIYLLNPKNGSLL